MHTDYELISLFTTLNGYFYEPVHNLKNEKVFYFFLKDSIWKSIHIDSKEEIIFQSTEEFHLFCLEQNIDLSYFGQKIKNNLAIQAYALKCKVNKIESIIGTSSINDVENG